MPTGLDIGPVGGLRRHDPRLLLSEEDPTPNGPRYATRKDFLYGEDITIGEWTISTENLPRYA